MSESCTCRTGRDQDGSEFGPCEHCERADFNSRMRAPVLASLVGLYSEIHEIRHRVWGRDGAHLDTRVWRVLRELAAEPNPHNDQAYRITDSGRQALKDLQP